MAVLEIELKKELLEILKYFKTGLKDVEVGSDETQPMLSRLDNVIEGLNSIAVITDVKFKNEGSGKTLIYKVQ